MKHMVPYNKMSKRQQKNEDSKRRNMWVISPVTKTVPNKKKDNDKTYDYDYDDWEE